MALSRAIITPEVFLTCTTHALTTEAEEIMGLLLGDIRDIQGSSVAYIRRVVPQIRTDRRKDRVETSPEQMASCSALAEQISSATGVPTRVVGWYHSHPHITVLPSHVDVNTQAMYQMLDPCFVGLIFSVFNSSASKEQTVQVTAFQSVPSCSGPWGDLQTVNSGDLELEGLDAQTQEALRASAAAHMQDVQAGGSSWQRKEVPLAVMQDSSNPSTLSDYVEVQKMLLAEEQEAHEQRISSTSSSTASCTDIHAALLHIHHSAIYQQALLQHAECVLAPAVAAMKALAAQGEVQAQQLEADNQRLQALLMKQQTGTAQKQQNPVEMPSTPLIELEDEARMATTLADQ